MPLETLSIQALTPRALPYKVADGKGLYILVTPTGKKLWRLKYRWAGKEGTLSFGAYPDVDVEAAREHRDAARDLLTNGVNPSDQAKLERAAQRHEPVRFSIDSNGALSFRLDKRTLALSPSETTELRAFLDATRAVNTKVMPCP